MARVEYASACYHVINRGNYRRDLFTGQGAAEAFERTLGQAAQRFSWRIHAYVVMSNHFHLALELTEPNLSLGMKWLQGTWVRRYNGLRQLVGRPFQGRYKAIMVEPGHAFGLVCHYIHLNPVRAGIVKSAEVVDYPWSSLRKFTVKPRPSWMESAVVLGEAGGLSDTKKGWESYQLYLEFLAEDEPSKKALVSKNLSQGWCIGGQEFKAQLRKELTARGAELEQFAGLEPEAVQEMREDVWEKQLQVLSGVAKINLSQLPMQKSHPEKVRLAAALKQSTSVSNSWLAARLGMGKPASASQFVRRYLLETSGQEATATLLKKLIKT